MPRPTTGARATRPCAYCGKPLTRLLSQAKGREWYCSHTCRAAHQPPPRSLSETPNPYRGQRETRPCSECGAPVTRYLTPKTNAAPWYCSYECMGRSQRRRLLSDGSWTQGRKPRTGETRECAVCGTAFYRQRAVLDKGMGRYCSRACHNAAQRKEQVTKPCERCGREMRLRPSETVRRFCSKRCEALAKTKRPTGREHNGRPVIEHSTGYLMIYEPTHPGANRSGRVLEHRWIVEQALGRSLTRAEQVDHINRDKQDNRLENLQILTPTAHTVKTNGDRKKRELTLTEQLAEYQRRFGPLPE